MSTFDFVILGLFSLFAGIGALRGAWREAMSIVAWLAAVLCGWLFADAVGTWFDALQDEELRRLLAFLATFMVVWSLLTVALFILRILLPRPEPNLQSRLMGGVLGGLRGAVVIAVLVLLAGLTSLPKKDSWREAYLVGFFMPVAHHMLEWLPAPVARQFRYS
jgi:membrane protein required for colicin V production